MLRLCILQQGDHKNSVYPKIETCYAFQPHMNDVFVNDFNNQTFNQDGNESAIL